MTATDRIHVIQKSLRVCVCGWLGLIPVLGLPVALYAVYQAIRLHLRFGREWNPAAAYLKCGLALSVLSLGLSLLAGGIILLNLVPPFGLE